MRKGHQFPFTLQLLLMPPYLLAVSHCFTLFHTAGNIDREALLPLVERYLASIPATLLPPPRDPATITPLEVAFPAVPVVEDVKVSAAGQ